MIDHDLYNIVKRDMQLSVDDQLQQATRAAFKIRSSGPYSSRTDVLIGEELKHVVDVRVQHSWSSLQRALRSAAVTYEDGLANELKGFMRDNIPPISDIKAVIRAGGQSGSNEGGKLAVEVALDNTWTHKMNRIENEIDLFVFGLRHSDDQNRLAGHPTVNNVFNGPVGAVQFGERSTANVNCVTDNREQLNRLIDIAHRHVADAGAGLKDRDEVLEVLVAAKTEVAQDKPSKLKLTSLMSGAGRAVELVAALRPAYEAIMDALDFLI